MSDLPILHMILHMGPEGYAISVLLLLLSVITLAIVLQKWSALKSRRKADELFLRIFSKTQAFHELPVVVSRTRGAGLRSIAEAALLEEETFPADDVSGRTEALRGDLIQEACERAVEEERIDMELRLSWLVVAAGTGPFLGLLGTVWGIMDAFFQIGQQASAGLNVVAPGIAQALFTTLAGLIVAIPAAAGHQFLSGAARRHEGEYLVFASRLASLYRREALTANVQPMGAAHHAGGTVR
jgi:biopolymer transport protein TolQ